MRGACCFPFFAPTVCFRSLAIFLAVLWAFPSSQFSVNNRTVSLKLSQQQGCSRSGWAPAELEARSYPPLPGGDSPSSHPLQDAILFYIPQIVQALRYDKVRLCQPVLSVALGVVLGMGPEAFSGGAGPPGCDHGPQCLSHSPTMIPWHPWPGGPSPSPTRGPVLLCG